MTARHLLSFGTAAGALSFAMPALAQDAPSPDESYQFAEPAPPLPPMPPVPPSPPPVVFQSQPVVQAVPAPIGAPAPAPVVRREEYTYRAAPPPMPQPMAMPAPPVAYAYPGGPAVAAPYPAAPYPPQAYAAPGYPPQAWGPPPGFDRDAWLDNCRERTRGLAPRDRGGVIGGLLGAITGGVIGNRSWHGERLAGTLLGAGVGGLAGLAIGTAVDAASRRRHDDECGYYLDRYFAPQGYGYAGYGYGYPQYYTMTYVPVLVAVPQHAVVRETVTTEWVDQPAPARCVIERRTGRKAPQAKIIPVKPSKYTKQR
jgi:hypothetical protein